jgi:2-polyprenyl-3-methyl-5-hydroxy-6-metoxy-1,4-benzoquinol methylase
VTLGEPAAAAAPVTSSTACPLCDSPRVDEIVARDVNRRVSHETFAYVRCQSCASLSLRNVPADLGRYYPASYYDVPPTLADLDGRAASEQFKVDLIQKWVVRGRLIEVGPAYGAFARRAQQAGFDVDTIERDERCCAFLRDVVGVGATQSDDVVAALERLADADVIALWHVLEHLPDPWETLAAAAGRLRPGGILVVASPNPDAMQFRLFRRFWAHLDAPRHLHLISPRALTRQAVSLGLEPALVTTSDAGSLGWNSFGWAVTLRNFFGPAPLRSFAHLTGRVVNKLVSPIERRGGRGSAYTIVLRRPVGPR